MSDPVRIEFRGVCLFVPRPSEGLIRVLLPLTDPPSPMSNARKHYARLTVYGPDDIPVGAPVSLSGQELQIVSTATPPEVRPPEKRFPRLIDLKGLVNDANVRVLANLQAGRNVEALITVKGGANWQTKNASLAGWVRHDDPTTLIPPPFLEAVWEETAGKPVSITFDQGPVVDVQPGQTAVIGHYDDEQHAIQRRISVRTPTWDAAGGANDEDFAWLYSLLTPQPGSKPVPRTFKPGVPTIPAALAKPGLLHANPLTTTCFSGTWEPEE